MWFDDADVQIIGMCSDDLDLKSKMEINKIITDFNESMRYKNVIKRQDKAIKQLKVDLLEEQIEEKDKENERLNNIINELEKDLLQLRLTDVDGKTIVYRLLNRIEKLKEGK